ncbi:MAG: hypothetical protein INF91_09060, partial [Alphaproteobacteria bacterium]|nr:hypothetical protein [Alphaproteobacteria bacterium]
MGKAVHADVLDGALAVIRSNATRMVALASQPPDYATANGGKLAEVTMAAADFSFAAGDISGRKVAVAAKTGAAVA